MLGGVGGGHENKIAKSSAQASEWGKKKKKKCLYENEHVFNNRYTRPLVVFCDFMRCFIFLLRSYYTTAMSYLKFDVGIVESLKRAHTHEISTRLKVRYCCCVYKILYYIM